MTTSDESEPGYELRLLAEGVSVGTATVPTHDGVHTMLALQFFGRISQDHDVRGVVTIYVPDGAPEFLAQVAQVVADHIDPAAVTTVEVVDE